LNGKDLKLVAVIDDTVNLLWW